MLKIEDIEKLAGLSRVEIPEEEKETLLKEVEGILAYVGEVKKAVGKKTLESMGEKELVNVMREDKDPHQSGEYTEKLLASAPKSHNGYVKVKKIF